MEKPLIRLSKQTDYGVVVLAHMAGHPETVLHSARDLAAESHLPLPMVSKVLKLLTREGFLLSHRGAKGGYSLARSPEDVTVLEVLRALEGPVGLTDCCGHKEHTAGDADGCRLESSCPTRSAWHEINRAFQQALAGLRLCDLNRAAAGCGASCACKSTNESSVPAVPVLHTLSRARSRL